MAAGFGCKNADGLECAGAEKIKREALASVKLSRLGSKAISLAWV